VLPGDRSGRDSPLLPLPTHTRKHTVANPLIKLECEPLRGRFVFIRALLALFGESQTRILLDNPRQLVFPFAAPEYEGHQYYSLSRSPEYPLVAAPLSACRVSFPATSLYSSRRSLFESPRGSRHCVQLDPKEPYGSYFFIPARVGTFLVCRHFYPVFSGLSLVLRSLAE